MQVQVMIAGMPLMLVCDIYNGGRVAFVRTAEFEPIFDYEPDGYLAAIFKEDDFSIDGDDFTYNVFYSYKQIPSMLRWLQRQRLQMPDLPEGV